MAQEKKIALITGANRGIGFETAKQLGETGVTIIAAARTQQSADETAAKLKALGIDSYGLKLEVTDPADQAAAVKYVEEKFGKLDILINNAGVAASTGFTPVNSQVTDEELLRIFSTNLFAVVALTRELLPLIKKSDAGRIVNLSSILGSLTLHADPNSPIAGFKSFAYDSSKTALNAYTIHLAWELKDTPIKVNSAHPGWVKTEMGTDAAPMEIPDGAKTSVALALLEADGPSGRFIHLGQELPW
ncbi:MAG TPA: SDR family oxidoreductase [Acidobacteriaceae bacterium]|jgi:NAD(P)-dependent dehydrogenase (short-subunit alcohol dehydrogenase family)|nr:SDR family oxidoreductase [Acidobacteriaceae bacterium]